MHLTEPDKVALKQRKEPSSFMLLDDQEEEMGNETPGGESPQGRMKAKARKHQRKKMT